MKHFCIKSIIIFLSCSMFKEIFMANGRYLTTMNSHDPTLLHQTASFVFMVLIDRN